MRCCGEGSGKRADSIPLVPRFARGMVNVQYFDDVGVRSIEYSVGVAADRHNSYLGPFG